MGKFYDFFEMEASLFLRVASQAERGEDVFGGDVADKLIAREGTAAEAGERAIEATAACIVRGENLVGGAHRSGVEVNANFHAGYVIARAAENFGYGFG